MKLTVIYLYLALAAGALALTFQLVEFSQATGTALADHIAKQSDVGRYSDE